MANNIQLRDGNGALFTLTTVDVGAGVQLNVHQISDGTNSAYVAALNAALDERQARALRVAAALMGTDSGAAAGSQLVALKVESTAQPNLRVGVFNAGNEMPSGDSAAREIFVGLADGTNGPAAVKAASTIAAAADKALVVSLSPNSPVVTSAEAAKAGATAATNDLLMGAEYLQFANLIALTTGQQGPLQCDPNGTLKVGEVPLGTPIYAGASAGATQNVATLTIPANKMGYLDGFDLDGLGATAGSAIGVTIVGLLGGTLTLQVGIPAGVTVPMSRTFRFNPPLRASAVNTNIVVTAPSYGTGNTAASVNAYGHHV